MRLASIPGPAIEPLHSTVVMAVLAMMLYPIAMLAALYELGRLLLVVFVSW